jgi:pyruvate/2-oxoglutarate dehydrogenase complex dihydrolipoamide acyltransferase (E2) component
MARCPPPRCKTPSSNTGLQWTKSTRFTREQPQKRIRRDNMALLEIQVPDIGDFDEVTVIELMVKPGDVVAPDQSLITVESDKASMEIPSSHGGTVKALNVKMGDKVKRGSVVLTMEVAGTGATAASTVLNQESEKQHSMLQKT